jgi:hypothetical protein
MNTCSICQQDYEGMGNSAEPVNHGRCCDQCDWRIITPIRIEMIKQQAIKLIAEGKLPT